VAADRLRNPSMALAASVVARPSPSQAHPPGIGSLF
jgi:hypothetical protein